MCLIGSAMLSRYCSASRLIPRRGSCSSMVRFHVIYASLLFLTSCALGVTFDHPAHIPLFLYPFLNTTSKTRPFEYLRLTSLGVIGALVKVRHPIQIPPPLDHWFTCAFDLPCNSNLQQNDNSTVIHFLLSTEIIPLCLRIMETGSELSKTVAIFIVQKILLDETGLTYICHTYERFYAVGTVLSNMVNQLVETQAVRLLKHVVRCYLRLSDNPR